MFSKYAPRLTIKSSEVCKKVTEYLKDLLLTMPRQKMFHKKKTHIFDYVEKSESSSVPVQCNIDCKARVKQIPIHWMFKYHPKTFSDNRWKFLQLSIVHERTRLHCSQQVLRFTGESTVLTLVLNFSKEFGVPFFITWIFLSIHTFWTVREQVNTKIQVFLR